MRWRSTTCVATPRGRESLLPARLKRGCFVLGPVVLGLVALGIYAVASHTVGRRAESWDANPPGDVGRVIRLMIGESIRLNWLRGFLNEVLRCSSIRGAQRPLNELILVAGWRWSSWPWPSGPHPGSPYRQPAADDLLRTTEPIR